MLLQSEMKAAEDKVALESQIQELKAMLKAEKVARGWLDKYTNDLVNRFLDLKSQIGAGDRVLKTERVVQTVCTDCCSQSHSPLQVHDPELSDCFHIHWDKLVEKSKGQGDSRVYGHCCCISRQSRGAQVWHISCNSAGCDSQATDHFFSHPPPLQRTDPSYTTCGNASDECDCFKAPSWGTPASKLIQCP